MPMFRTLRADEIDVRVAQVAKDGKWCTLLLYKDARCDQNILDETVGPNNWQRHHSRDNANCIVSIWDENKAQWIEKEDTGTESNTEAAKGLASDSFKRACFNWGIGRELYTAPTIFVWKDGDNGENFEVKTGGSGKPQPKADFYCSGMEVVDGKIVYLQIKNRKKSNKIVYTWGKPGNNPDQQSFRLPEQEPVAPAPTPATDGPVPYQRKDDVPATEQPVKNQAFNLFKEKYPDCKKPGKCFAWIFQTNADTTEKQWKNILQCVREGDYRSLVDDWNKNYAEGGAA